MHMISYPWQYIHKCLVHSYTENQELWWCRLCRHWWYLQKGRPVTAILPSWQLMVFSAHSYLVLLLNVSEPTQLLTHLKGSQDWVLRGQGHIGRTREGRVSVQPTSGILHRVKHPCITALYTITEVVMWRGNCRASGEQKLYDVKIVPLRC